MNPGVLIFEALRNLVSGDRVYADEFPQTPSTPVWPSIRYTGAGGTSYPTICGDGSSDEDDVRVQIDIVTTTSAERTTLTESVRTAMKTLTPPAILQGPPQTTFDSATKTFRCTIDFVIYGSSTS